MVPGVFTTVFPRPTVEATFDAIAVAGVRAAHVDFASFGLDDLPATIPAGLPGRIGAAARERGVEIVALAGMFNMAHPDPARRAAGLARFRTVALAARPMGCAVVGLCTGTRDPENMWRGHPDNGTPAAWADLRATLDAALAIADEADVTLVVECEPANVIRDAHAGRRLLDEAGHPRLKVVLDPANILAGVPGQDPADALTEAFALLGPDIVAAHAKDLSASGEFCAAGTGIVPWPHLIGLLRGIGYSDPLVMHTLTEADVPQALATLAAAGA